MNPMMVGPVDGLWRFLDEMVLSMRGYRGHQIRGTVIEHQPRQPRPFDGWFLWSGEGKVRREGGAFWGLIQSRLGNWWIQQISGMETFLGTTFGVTCWQWLWFLNVFHLFFFQDWGTIQILQVESIGISEDFHRDFLSDFGWHPHRRFDAGQVRTPWRRGTKGRNWRMGSGEPVFRCSW